MSEDRTVLAAPGGLGTSVATGRPAACDRPLVGRVVELDLPGGTAAQRDQRLVP